jgi:hypothetical protein
MTTTAATYHDTEPYAVKGNGMASARCLTHQTATAEQWPTMRTWPWSRTDAWTTRCGPWPSG